MEGKIIVAMSTKTNYHIYIMKPLLVLLAVGSMTACTATSSLQNPHSSISAAVSFGNDTGYYVQPGIITPAPCYSYGEPRIYDSYGYAQGNVLYRRLTPCY